MEDFSWDEFNKVPVVGILRGLPQKNVEILANYYLQAGFTTLEVTMNSLEAESTIRALIDSFGDNLNIGAGTVCTMQDLERAISAGANFIVTPIVNAEVISTCVEIKIPVFAGAYTPSEIYHAWSLGAAMVKVFPAGRLGPEYIKEVLAPLSHIKLLPTGGITFENFTSFLKAGASGIGVGSMLFPQQLIKSNKWAEVSDLLNAFINSYNNYQLNNKYHV